MTIPVSCKYISSQYWGGFALGDRKILKQSSWIVLNSVEPSNKSGIGFLFGEGGHRMQLSATGWMNRSPLLLLKIIIRLTNKHIAWKYMERLKTSSFFFFAYCMFFKAGLFQQAAELSQIQAQCTAILFESQLRAIEPCLDQQNRRYRTTELISRREWVTAERALGWVWCRPWFYVKKSSVDSVYTTASEQFGKREANIKVNWGINQSPSRLIAIFYVPTSWSHLNQKGVNGSWPLQKRRVVLLITTWILRQNETLHANTHHRHAKRSYAH